MIVLFFNEQPHIMKQSDWKSCCHVMLFGHKKDHMTFCSQKMSWVQLGADASRIPATIAMFYAYFMEDLAHHPINTKRVKTIKSKFVTLFMRSILPTNKTSVYKHWTALFCRATYLLFLNLETFYIQLRACISRPSRI